MSTLYLHIGTPKTGTTAIQFFLQNNSRVLLKSGYLFPNMKVSFNGVPAKRNGHFLIGNAYQTENENYGEAEKSACMQKLIDYLDNNPNVILTDEMIWHACNRFDNFWEWLYRAITEKGHSLKVIVYLRRQDEFIQSYWKYKVLSAETMSFDKYVSSKKYRFFPLDYYTHLSKIAAGIQKENLLVRVYEKEQYEGNPPTIISDFMYTIGLPLTDQYQVSDKLQNTNIDCICTEIKRRLNSMPEFHDKNGFLRGYMSKLSEQNREKNLYQVSSLFYDSKKQDEFLAKYAEENRKTATEFLGRDDGKLFYSPVRYASPTQKAFTSKDYVEVCGNIFLSMETDIQRRGIKSRAARLVKGLLRRE